jgi:hypothetical protein
MKLAIQFCKLVYLFLQQGPELIFELLNVPTLYIPDCMEELYAFHKEFLTAEYIISAFGEQYYLDYYDFCYGDHVIKPNFEPSPFDPDKYSDAKPVLDSEGKAVVKLRRRLSDDPHPGFYFKTKEYLDFLAKKLTEPFLEKYSSSKDLLGDTFPPKDGSLIYDFYGEGIPYSYFPKQVYYNDRYPFDSLPNLTKSSYMIPFDGYSIDGLILNIDLDSEPAQELVYGFSRNIIMFSKTVFDFVLEPGPIDSELQDFLYDVYSASVNPKFMRQVFYKSKSNVKPRPFGRGAVYPMKRGQKKPLSYFFSSKKPKKKK